MVRVKQRRGPASGGSGDPAGGFQLVKSRGVMWKVGVYGVSAILKFVHPKRRVTEDLDKNHLIKDHFQWKMINALIYWWGEK